MAARLRTSALVESDNALAGLASKHGLSFSLAVPLASTRTMCIRVPASATVRSVFGSRDLDDRPAATFDEIVPPVLVEPCNGLAPGAVAGRDLAHAELSKRLQRDNRHLVPRAVEDGIVVNIPQRMLFLFKAGRLVGGYPVAVGRPDWRTPIGMFRVLEKQHQKVWNVPKSIQEEMRREGQVVKQEVPPGPENPLGEYWIRISLSCGIHGTNFPANVYSATTHGCLRLQPEAIAEIDPLIDEGMPVEIIYEPLLYARIGDQCYLEVNRDVYGLHPPALEPIEAWAAASSLTDTINWRLVMNELRSKRGIAQGTCG